jgi:cysteine-rich repeat protein
MLFTKRLVCAVLLGGCLILVPACNDDSGDDPVCGNGTVEPPEQCDDGNTVSGDGCSAVCQNESGPICGNGTQEAGEECDDGNNVSGDGCSATCQNEGGPVCGNGTQETGEQCDDGNTDDGDGCSSTCQIEHGTASVSGTAARGTGTCPDAIGSIGTLCLSLRSDCATPSTEVVSTTVANADMNGPVGFSNPVPFTITDVPDGTYQLFSILDKDSSGCDAATTDDLELAAGCVQVVVSGGTDVTGVTIVFDTIAQ